MSDGEAVWDVSRKFAPGLQAGRDADSPEERAVGAADAWGNPVVTLLRLEQLRFDDLKGRVLLTGAAPVALQVWWRLYSYRMAFLSGYL